MSRFLTVGAFRMLRADLIAEPYIGATTLESPNFKCGAGITVQSQPNVV